MADWFRADRDGILITVRLTPKGGADRVTGSARLADGTTVLAVRVKAAPEKGTANAALVKLIARALGMAPAEVAIVSGHKARNKILRVAARADQIGDRLAALGRAAQ